MGTTVLAIYPANVHAKFQHFIVICLLPFAATLVKKRSVSAGS